MATQRVHKSIALRYISKIVGLQGKSNGPPPVTERGLTGTGPVRKVPDADNDDASITDPERNVAFEKETTGMIPARTTRVCLCNTNKRKLQ